jgi:hypothetical protein
MPVNRYLMNLLGFLHVSITPHRHIVRIVLFNEQICYPRPRG